MEPTQSPQPPPFVGSAELYSCRLASFLLLLTDKGRIYHRGHMNSDIGFFLALFVNLTCLDQNLDPAVAKKKRQNAKSDEINQLKSSTCQFQRKVFWHQTINA